jgi:hypothetical protein
MVTSSKASPSRAFVEMFSRHPPHRSLTVSIMKLSVATIACAALVLSQEGAANIFSSDKRQSPFVLAISLARLTVFDLSML